MPFLLMAGAPHHKNIAQRRAQAGAWNAASAVGKGKALKEDVSAVSIASVKESQAIGV